MIWDVEALDEGALPLVTAYSLVLQGSICDAQHFADTELNAH